MRRDLLPRNIDWDEVENIIFVDGAMVDETGSYAITDIKGKLLERGDNIDCHWQIEVEAVAALRGVQYAIKQGWDKVIILTDSQAISQRGFYLSGKSRAPYLMDYAAMIAHQNDLDVKFSWVRGSENKADKYSRP